MVAKSRFDPSRVTGIVSSLLITGYSSDDARRFAIQMESERVSLCRMKLMNNKLLSKARFEAGAHARIEGAKTEGRADGKSSVPPRSTEAESRLHQPQQDFGETKPAPTTTTSTSTCSTSGESNPKTVIRVSEPMVNSSKGDSDDEGERRRRSHSQESELNIVKLRSKSYVSDTAKRRPVKPRKRATDCVTPSCSQSTEERSLSRVTKELFPSTIDVRMANGDDEGSTGQPPPPGTQPEVVGTASGATTTSNTASNANANASDQGADNSALGAHGPIESDPTQGEWSQEDHARFLELIGKVNQYGLHERYNLFGPSVPPPSSHRRGASSLPPSSSNSRDRANSSHRSHSHNADDIQNVRSSSNVRFDDANTSHPSNSRLDGAYNSHPSGTFRSNYASAPPSFPEIIAIQQARSGKWYRPRENGTWELHYPNQSLFTYAIIAGRLPDSEVPPDNPRVDFSQGHAQQFGSSGQQQQRQQQQPSSANGGTIPINPTSGQAQGGQGTSGSGTRRDPPRTQVNPGDYMTESQYRLFREDQARLYGLNNTTNANDQYRERVYDQGSRRGYSFDREEDSPNANSRPSRDRHRSDRDDHRNYPPDRDNQRGNSSDREDCRCNRSNSSRDSDDNRSSRQRIPDNQSFYQGHDRNFGRSNPGNLSLKPPLAHCALKFDGKGMTDCYLDMLDRYVPFYKNNPNDMLRDVLLTLTGDAKEKYYSYYKTFKTYADFKKWIKDAFQPPALRQIMRQHFVEVLQREGESASDYIDRKLGVIRDLPTCFGEDEKVEELYKGLLSQYMDWVKLKDTPTVSDLRTAAYEQEKQWENKRIRMRQERALLTAEENESHRGKQRNCNLDGGSQQNNASNANNFGNRAQNNSSSNTGS